MGRRKESAYLTHPPTPVPLQLWRAKGRHNAADTALLRSFTEMPLSRLERGQG
jgi:hypothetical protein